MPCRISIDLITFSSARLKRIGEKALPCLSPVLNLKFSDVPMPNFTLHIVFVLHAFMKSISFLGIPYSSRAAHSLFRTMLS
ncbi:Uncharacterized protein FWK35_00020261 [Aphis craccivora]|uniref:Uncharacterized protein n=1 Tax=Aphis craccivora TaxID=307492 RepID=A0A6G0YDA4_APHCR|nr:Uncharacterized protein FWK35_00020261 [Aphis craccivora]